MHERPPYDWGGLVDAYVTDPPYGLLGEALATGDNWLTETGKTKTPWERINEDWDKVVPTAWIPEAFRTLKVGGTLLCFCTWQTVEQLLAPIQAVGFERRAIIVWNKVGTMPNLTNRGYRYTYEMIIWATKGANYTWNAKRQRSDIIRLAVATARNYLKRPKIHPAEKPLLLLSQFIMRHTNERDLILDPFMGCGSTGVACVIKRRDFLGIEIDAAYYASAQEQIDRIGQRTQ